MFSDKNVEYKTELFVSNFKYLFYIFDDFRLIRDFESKLNLYMKSDRFRNIYIKKSVSRHIVPDPKFCPDAR